MQERFLVFADSKSLKDKEQRALVVANRAMYFYFLTDKGFITLAPPAPSKVCVVVVWNSPDYGLAMFLARILFCSTRI